MELLTPGWEDYELIDSGGLEKLERYGEFVLCRPEPQAVWKKAMPETEWQRMADAVYKRAKGLDPSKSEFSEKGEWSRKPKMPDRWTISYKGEGFHLKFRLALTSFGHIGIFPEQASNWTYIFDFLNKSEIKNQRVLNLFAYTGAGSLAAKAAGADVVHVDSVKPVISWGRENMEASGLNDIRWVVEDALKFVRREAKRGNKYHGIIIDPPAYGRGPEGEKWVLQDSIDEMVGLCSQLLEPQHSFFILSLYSMGFSALISESLVKTHFRDSIVPESGELYFDDRAGRKLPLGTYLRFSRPA
jgi:23S rRNA (cytosine1962-C5)-methyltransferase